MPLLASSVNGLWKNDYQKQGEFLCRDALQQARTPIFYEQWDVPDTLEGRFDMASLHIILILRYIRGHLAQVVFDSFFSYTDHTLREIGVGDLNIGRQVKKCASFFYGTMRSYHNALEGKEDLEQALIRNVFNGLQPKNGVLSCLIKYVRESDALLNDQELQTCNRILWPGPK